VGTERVCESAVLEKDEDEITALASQPEQQINEHDGI
jgi:hypothetical protein